MQEKTDIEIIASIRNGASGDFSLLVKRHQKHLFQFLVRYLKSVDMAEDVAQEAFVRAYTKLHTFEERASFKSWLYRIALNIAKNKFRAKDIDAISIDVMSMSKKPEAESALVFEAVKKRIQVEIEKLPQRQKTALLLRVFEDLSFQEIAESMDCPYDTAKANYRHALLKLKESMEVDAGLRSWLAEQNLDDEHYELNRTMET